MISPFGLWISRFDGMGGKPMKIRFQILKIPLDI
jgi:hypothetical protein